MTYGRNVLKLFDYQAGTELQLYLPWGMELYNDLTYFLRTGYGYEGYAKANFMWNCQLSKAFFEEETVTNPLQNI